MRFRAVHSHAALPSSVKCILLHPSLPFNSLCFLEQTPPRRPLLPICPATHARTITHFGVTCVYFSPPPDFNLYSFQTLFFYPSLFTIWNNCIPATTSGSLTQSQKITRLRCFARRHRRVIAHKHTWKVTRGVAAAPLRPVPRQRCPPAPGLMIPGPVTVGDGMSRHRGERNALSPAVTE